MYNLIFLNLTGNYFGILLYNTYNNFEKKIKIIYRKKIPKWLILLLLFSFIFFLINNMYYISYFKENFTYVDIYKQNIGNKNNIIIRLLSAIFYPMLIIAFSYFSRNRKVNFILCLLLLVSNFCFSIIGSRSYIIGATFFIIYYLYINFDMKLRIKKLGSILILGLILIVFSQYFANYRMNEKFQETNYMKILKNFIYEQGITGTFLGLLKDKPELFQRGIPYILSSITGENVFQTKEGYEVAVKSKNINLIVQMSARSNKILFLEGAGMGGNYIIEMYDFLEEKGILFLSFLHTYVSLYLFSNIKKFNFEKRIFLNYILLNGYFLIPRVNFFPNIFSKRLVYILLFYLFIKFMNSIKLRKEV